MTQPINIPGRRNSTRTPNNSLRTNSFGASESPYFHISPTTDQPDFHTIKLYHILKSKLDNQQQFNITNFFQHLHTTQYSITSKQDKFIRIQDDNYTHKIDFHYNRNYLSLYTDFILHNPEKTLRISVYLNGDLVYDVIPDSTDMYSFFLSRPNTLPLCCQNILEFNLTIYVNTAPTASPKLIYSEIKTKPAVNLILNLLSKWYLKDSSQILYLHCPDSCQLIDNTWEWLLQIPEIKSLELTTIR